MIERHKDLDPRGSWLDLYMNTFADIDGLAAQRHLMTGDEFRDVAMDPRITKHVAWAERDDGQYPAGLSVITNHLDAWPLISPRYFQRRWPLHYEDRRIFYIGFVCVKPNAPTSTFRDLITDMSEQVFAADGIAVMDFCTANVVKGLPRATGWLLNNLHDKAVGGRIDAQEFWAWRFDGQQP